VGGGEAETRASGEDLVKVGRSGLGDDEERTRPARGLRAKRQQQQQLVVWRGWIGCVSFALCP